MLAGSSWLGSLPATTWQRTHCHFSKSSLPVATVAAATAGFGS
jgi:hypothetical protein